VHKNVLYYVLTTKAKNIECHLVIEKKSESRVPFFVINKRRRARPISKVAELV
jgi:hypothetical protein